MRTLRSRLLFLLLLILAVKKSEQQCKCAQGENGVHGVVAQLVDVFRRRNDADPVADRVLFEEFFGEVLEVALREVDRGGDGEF
jgi:hypothetical protein